VAHAHDLGDGFHRQAVAVGLADGFIALVSQFLELCGQRILTSAVVLGKGGETRASFGSLASDTGDERIVRPILASRLA
jgi:hypothetical protein